MGAYGLGFNQPITALVVGGSGGVGRALAERLLTLHPENRVYLTSRRAPVWGLDDERAEWLTLDITDEQSWRDALLTLDASLSARQTKLNLVFNATGLLHDETHTPPLQPERSMRTLELDSMSAVFAVNTFGVALALRYLTPRMTRAERAVFASCSARVGSIGDNRIGGWYSYRASKAAQHMLIKTAAIELGRSWRHMICVALHPGTVDTSLSAPFTSRTPAERLFTPQRSAAELSAVIEQLTTKRSGEAIAWDGLTLPW